MQEERKYEQLIPTYEKYQEGKDSWEDWENPHGAFQPYRIDANPRRNFAWPLRSGATLKVRFVRRHYAWHDYPVNGSPSEINDRAEIVGIGLQINQVFLNGFKSLKSLELIIRLGMKRIDLKVPPGMGMNLFTHGIGEKIILGPFSLDELGFSGLTPQDLGPYVLKDGYIPESMRDKGIPVSLTVTEDTSSNYLNYGLSYIAPVVWFIPKDRIKPSSFIIPPTEQEGEPIDLDDHSLFMIGPDVEPCQFSAYMVYDYQLEATRFHLHVVGKNGYRPTGVARMLLFDPGHWYEVPGGHPNEPLMMEEFKSGKIAHYVSDFIPWAYATPQDEFYSLFHFNLIGENDDVVRIGWNHAITRLRPSPGKRKGSSKEVEKNDQKG